MDWSRPVAMETGEAGGFGNLQGRCRTPCDGLDMQDESQRRAHDGAAAADPSSRYKAGAETKDRGKARRAAWGPGMYSGRIEFEMYSMSSRSCQPGS